MNPEPFVLVTAEWHGMETLDRPLDHGVLPTRVCMPLFHEIWNLTNPEKQYQEQ